ncbi:N-6 DNA methylase [Pseudonocardia sp. DLS-67]
MTRTPQWVSAVDVARRAGVGSAAVSNWRKRHPDFPAPRRVGATEMFVFSEIAEWLGSRRIPKNALGPDELPGTTYGDRFLLQGRSTEAARTAGSIPVRPGSDLAQRVWSAFVKARGTLDIDSAFDLLVALLIIRIRASTHWRQLKHDGRSDLLRFGLDHVLRDLANGSVPVHLPDPEWDAGGDESIYRFIHVLDELEMPGDRGGVIHFLLELQALMASATARGGDTHTPRSVVRVMVGVADPISSDRVYDPFCRSGELLLGAVLHAERGNAVTATAALTGHAVNQRYVRRTSMAAALAGVKMTISSSMALDADLDHEKWFDVVLANPPFNLTDWRSETRTDSRRWPYGEPPRHNANFAWLQHAVTVLRPGGRAAVLTANGATSSQNPAEVAIREQMVEAGAVECVMALPPGLFAATGIPVTLWVLRAPRQVSTEVLFIDATLLGSTGDRRQRVLGDDDIEQIVSAYRDSRGRGGSVARELPPGFARSVHLEEIRERRFVLNPRSYIATRADAASASSARSITELRLELAEIRNRAGELDRLLDYSVTRVDEKQVDGRPESSLGWQRALLGDICDILAGPGHVARTMGRRTPQRLVVPRTIRYNGLVGDTEFVTEREAARLTRYRLEQGDVVCVRTGEPGRSGLVGPGQQGWLLGPGCIRLRPRRIVDSSYLVYCLGAPAARDWIDRNRTGSAINSISTRTLGDLPIMLPPTSVQRDIGEVLGALDANAMLHDRIGSIVVELRERLLAALMSGAAGIGE